jgi:hypothetical protein
MENLMPEDLFILQHNKELIFILKFIPKPILFLYNRILIFYVFPFFLELFFVI